MIAEKPARVRTARQLSVVLEDNDIILRRTADGLAWGRVNYDTESVAWEYLGGLDGNSEVASARIAIYELFGDLMRSKHEGGLVLLLRKHGYGNDPESDLLDKLDESKTR